MTLARPNVGEVCFAFGYGNMTTGDPVPNEPGLVQWTGSLHACSAEIEQVHTAGRGYPLTFPCFMTNADYPRGMSGGPITRPTDNRVIGVVSFGMDVKADEVPPTGYGAVFAAILGSAISLPDENGELRSYDYQALADNYLVDTDDVEFTMKRDDHGCSIVWPDERE